MSRIEPEDILSYSGFSVNDAKTIPPLKSGWYEVLRQPLTGDAPKDFVRVYEYHRGTQRSGKPHTWPLYIAKVGHKWYPNESITEHLLTRVGESLGLNMAMSRLMMVHGQIRFFSRYFLRRNESLVHGAQIFGGYLQDPEFVERVEEEKEARNVFTLEFVIDAIKGRFAGSAEVLLKDFVRMLAFDAIVGNNDRHHYNWGVIVHALGHRPPRFSPIYDSARALFWNESERKLYQRWKGPGSQRSDFLESYIERSRPKIGCDGIANPNHFQLLGRVTEVLPGYNAVLEDLQKPKLLEDVSFLLETEFGNLFSPIRKEVILECLSRRLARYKEVVSQ